MPRDYGFRLHQYQRFRPVRPKTSEKDPNEPVRLSQPRPWLFPLANRQLLDPAGHGDGTIMGQHVTIERIQARIADIGLEHAFSQVV